MILHRDKHLRAYQTFVFDDWLGGFYASPNMQGSRPGLPMATAWAVMHRLGLAGYRELTRTTIAVTRTIAEAVRTTPGLRLLSEPDAHLLAIAGDGADVFAVGEALGRRGWYLDRQTPPDALHLTVSAGNAPVVTQFLADLAAAVDEAAGVSSADRSTDYATLE